MIRKLMAVVQGVRTAPPSNLELFLGIACVMVGARAVQRYVTHQQVLLGQNLATLAAVKQAARQASAAADEWRDETGVDPLANGYPAAEDLAPLTTPPRRYMSDDPADAAPAEDIL